MASRPRASGEPDLGVGAVEDDPPLLPRVVEQVERLERELEVLQRRDVQRGQQAEHVARVERGQHVVGERRRRVDDDEVEHALEDAQHVGDQRRRDAFRRARLDRRDQRRQAGGVRRQQSGEAGLVERAGQRDGVGDRVRGEELQRDRDVAEREVEVDQADLASPAVGEGDGEVGRERGLAAAALGREDRHDPAARAFLLAVDRSLDLLTDLSADVVRPADRVGQRGQLAIGDDLPDAGSERLGEHARVEAPADHDHAERRVLAADGAGEVECRLGVDRDPEDDDGLPRRLVEVPAHLVEPGQERAVAADGGRQRLGCIDVVVDDDGHVRRFRSVEQVVDVDARAGRRPRRSRCASPR